MFNLTGKVALVTGAAQGLGRAMALALAEAGADVMLVDRNEAGARETAARIETLGRRAVAARCDVSDPAQIRELFRQLDAEFGRIDFLGNVAGDGVLGAPEEISLEDGRAMLAQPGPRPLLHVPGSGPPHAGRRPRQHRQHRLARQHHRARARPHRLQHGDGGGGADDARTQHGMGRPRRARQRDPAGASGQPRPGAAHGRRPALRDKFLSGIPAGRLGQPDDIKGLAVFLASDASRWITGALIPMDGGNLAMNAGGTIGPTMKVDVSRSCKRSESDLLVVPRRCSSSARREEQLARSHQRGLIHGACHTYVGQEAIAVGVCAHLRQDDVVFSTHRGHGHALAKGLPPRELIAELFGRATGCSRGRGGSMHLFAPEIG